MTPLEELQAAHDHLSALRNQACPGPWEPGEWDTAPGWEHRQTIASGDMGEVTEYIDTLDVQLIVTLHRTIDAQLMLLADALEQANMVGRNDGHQMIDKIGLALARAINGEAS